VPFGFTLALRLADEDVTPEDPPVKTDGARPAVTKVRSSPLEEPPAYETMSLK
jgi:hypothetical protein